MDTEAAEPAAPPEVQVGADVTAATAYVDAGITVCNRPVVQGDVRTEVKFGDGTLRGMAWSTAEPLPYGGPRAVSEVEGRGPDVTEVALYADYTRTIGAHAVGVGAGRYLYPNTHGATASWNTTEVLASWSAAGRWVPSLLVAADVDLADGVRATGGLARALVDRRVRVDLGGAVSAAAGEQEYYGRDGLTHGEVVVRAIAPAGAWLFAAEARGLAGVAPTTRTPRAARAWESVTVSRNVRVGAPP